MNIQANKEYLTYFEALASSVRLNIIELLNEEPMNIKQLAAALGLSSAIITNHIKKLEEARIVKAENIPANHGTQKVCSLAISDLHVKLTKDIEKNKFYSSSIPIGQYFEYDVYPTCGISTYERVIGMFDDPRYFSDPEHVKADILWFGKGYVKYRIPYYLLVHQEAKTLEISLEICSEAPNYNHDWPSDISFFVNDIYLGYWTSPGDFGDTHGNYTPSWWNNRSQYGRYKSIRITTEGSYIDGIKLSDVNIGNLNLEYGKDIIFTLAVLDTSNNIGGLTLFGRNFGNYNQDIDVKIYYKDK